MRNVLGYLQIQAGSAYMPVTLGVAIASGISAQLFARVGTRRYPVPVVLLARLAVDVSVSRRGLGGWLLQDAMTRTLAASQTIGARAMLVHAIENEAREFYVRHGLEPSPTDPLHLMILIKDTAAALMLRRKVGQPLDRAAAPITNGARPLRVH